MKNVYLLIIGEMLTGIKNNWSWYYTSEKVLAVGGRL